MGYLLKKMLFLFGFIFVISLFIGGTWVPYCSATTIQLEKSGKVAVFPNTDYRFKDVAGNDYAPSYQYNYTYDQATVTVTFQEAGLDSLTGHLVATGLKPNFAYQVKLEGKPEGLYGGEGDDSSNEVIGFTGRWWREQPNPGNSSDADYIANHDDPAYIFVGYLLFDFFLTDQYGNSEFDFKVNRSYHVLQGTWSGSPSGCNNPLKEITVMGSAMDDAYSADITTEVIGVYPTIERTEPGVCTKALPLGDYNCRLVLTEECFHEYGGPSNPGWVTVLDKRFQRNGGDYFYAGVNSYYLMTWAADPNLRPYVDEVFEDCKKMGLNVLRTWAFNDGADQWNALQTAPGVYDETVFEGLDYVVAKAREYGVQLILPFVNNWDDYGGMNQYVEWNMPFVTVNGMQFEIDGEPFYFTGANFWTAMNLASEGAGGDRARLDRELDFLASQGVTVLRVMAGTEGPDTELARVVPALQVAKGAYNQDLLDGLDYLMYAMKKRGMYAVMCLTNFWNWSGGMSQYVNWATGATLPIRQPMTGYSHDDFMDYTEVFYSNAAAKEAYLDHFDFIATRLNPYTGIAYKDEPAIMAWEHANEPMGWHNVIAFNQWIDDAAAHFKSVAPNHLVTVGTWGSVAWGTNLTDNHDGPNIDYTTIHIWPENFGQFDPENAAPTYPGALNWSRNYFNAEAAKSAAIPLLDGGQGKPMVLEEFNLGRDAGSINGRYDPSSLTFWRDTFLTDMFAAVHASAQSGGPGAGDQFWAWGGEGRPIDFIKWTYPGPVDWMPGDPWIGDPMHEPQGWYSVYDIDASTLAVISTHAAEMKALSSNNEMNHDDFYTNADCKQWFKDHIDQILNRENTINGIVYKDDPTIFAWELANEPDCRNDPSCGLDGWIAEMSGYIKSQDPAHLVTTGIFGELTGNGVDFVANHDHPGIDFVTFHSWPDHQGQDYASAMIWTENYFDNANLNLNKPVIFEEFNKRRALDQSVTERNQHLAGWYDICYAKAATGAAAGSNFWMLHHGPAWWDPDIAHGDDVYPDYGFHEENGFGIWYPGESSTIDIIEQHARQFTDLSSPEARGGWWAEAMVFDDLQFSLGDVISQIEPIPVDSAPIPCSGTKEVGFHFTRDPGDEHVRAYSVRVKILGGLSFGEEDITVHVDDALPLGESDYLLEVYQVSGASGSDWTIDFAISGDMVTGIPSGIDLFTIVFHGASEGLGTVYIEESRFRAIDGSPVTVDDNSTAEIEVDCTAPGTVPDITATTDSGNTITVKWGSAGENLTYEIWRSPWYRYVAPDTFLVYPEYNDWTGNIWPTNPTSYSNAVSSEEWNLAGEVAPGLPLEFQDDNWGSGLERNLYIYEVFARDLSGNHSNPTDNTAYALSYLLGDVALTWDGLIDTGDLSALGAAYGTVDGDGDPPYNAHCDVGPTSDHSGSGIPDTDNRIEFEDLMIFAMNYDMDLSKIDSQPTGGSPIAMLTWSRVTENSWSLVLLEQCQDLKGLRLRADLPAGGVVSLAAGELLAGQEVPYFLQNIPAHGLDVGMALLGKSFRIVGAGELFRVTLEGDHDLGDLEIEVRSTGNELIDSNLTKAAETTEIPTRFALSANYPNPFNPSTKIDFALPAAEHVKLAIYGADGRRIATLVDGPMPAGHHTVTWTGRSDQGGLLASGIYFFRIEAGSFGQTHKMTLLK